VQTSYLFAVHLDKFFVQMDLTSTDCTVCCEYVCELPTVLLRCVPGTRVSGLQRVLGISC